MNGHLGYQFYMMPASCTHVKKSGGTTYKAWQQGVSCSYGCSINYNWHLFGHYWRCIGLYLFLWVFILASLRPLLIYWRCTVFFENRLQKMQLRSFHPSCGCSSSISVIKAVIIPKLLFFFIYMYI